MFAAFLLVLVAVLAWTLHARKLTPAGAASAAVLAVLIWMGLGPTGVLLLAGFFFLGTGATRWGRRRKEADGLAENSTGSRKAGQVFANGGVPGLLGLAGIIWPVNSPSLLLPMAAGAFAAAAADTLSSELGVLYGRRFFNITSFKPDVRGRDGVVSLEGTLVGAGGAVLMALLFLTGSGADANHFFWIVGGGIAGNLIDSVLGATLERKGVLGNNSVNTINTLVGALVVAIGIACT